MRRLFVVSFVLVFLGACRTFGQDTTVNVTINVGRNDCACGEKSGEGAEPKRGPGHAGPPCHCLQALYLDYAGPEDLYICLTYHETECSGEEEELWFGEPTELDLPQVCEDLNCEPYVTRDKRKALPGHGMNLNPPLDFEVIEVGLKLARLRNEMEWGDRQYHVIPAERIPDALGLSDEITVLAVPITIKVKDHPLLDRTLYLCVQVDSAPPGGITPADFGQGMRRTGRQFALQYKVEGRERQGFVWLK